ncbi:hypothetical protein [Alteribacter natronophilus]|uniref:hypothetical protein n=1 Tax=Alteribacter natronophilus TaxID=2583810 RepID=UPI00110E80AC|nr:hypothetical protein [Alteribacter natronophilus]TMW70972.1 hypothetical protein FGB90_13440 [Alteribacter natronophilus]
MMEFVWMLVFLFAVMAVVEIPKYIFNVPSTRLTKAASFLVMAVVAYAAGFVPFLRDWTWTSNVAVALIIVAGFTFFRRRETA